jgi:hypothetical protein
MNLEEAIKAFLPLTFIAIWAIASLFSRDNRAVAGRAAQGAGPRPGGPRPGGPGATDPAARWAGQQAPVRGAPVTRPGQNPAREEILIIRQEPSRPPARPAPAPAAQGARRQARARPAQQAAPRRPDPAPPRSTLGAMTGMGGVQQQIAKPVEMARLKGVQSNLAEQSSSNESSVASARPAAGPTPGASLVRQLAASDKLREVVILSEILRPPITVRARRRNR